MFSALAMEGTLAAVATLVLLLEIAGTADKRILAYVSLGGLVLTGLVGLVIVHPAVPTQILGGSYIGLEFAQIFRRFGWRASPSATNSFGSSAVRRW